MRSPFWTLARGLLASALLVGTFAAGACAETEGPPPATGGRSGSGGVDGGGTGGGATGGAGAFGGVGGGTGGSSATGGTGGTANTCVQDPTIDPTAFPECPLCTGARCVPTSLVPPEQVDLLADCPEPDTKCVPDYFVATAGKFLAKTCRSLANAEGRCLSVCIPQVDAQKDRLPQDVCADGELCAPCYDPTTGVETGACSAGCDTGPTEPAVVFAKCCGGEGSCVPTSLVPADQQAQLGADTCTQSGYLCAPSKLVDPTYIPPTCRAIFGSLDMEGRCLPSCVGSIQAQADRLSQGTCAAGELCAPCYDPISGNLTGACSLNGDQAVEAAQTFPKCCNDLGACVPKSLIPDTQEASLGVDSCTGTDVLCVPAELSDSRVKPPTCTAVFGPFNFEGRCLPDCLPDVQAQADRLSQGTCTTHHLCTPCWDPLTGAATGACAQNGDQPATSASANTFPKCCSTIGACVPVSLIPDAQEADLGKDTCTQSGVLCVPTELSDPTFIPPTCDSLGGCEGRCLPACLPAIAAQADRLQQATCAQYHECAPCTDPISGAPTAACTLNGDSRKKPVCTFPKCCPNTNGQTRGTCVPDVALTASQASSLPQDSCPDATWSCVPDLKANDPTAKFPTCTVQASIPCLFGGCPGACVPDCILDATTASLLFQGPCQQGELCAPCTDPFGASTGACD